VPNLSIITINLNNLVGLQKTMQSVFEQNFSGYEYIIVDGGSTDGSKEYMTQFSDKLSYSVSEKDNGVYDAMNKGIAKARGTFLMFLNSGDFLVNQNVLMSLNKYVTTEVSDIFYGNIQITDQAGSVSHLQYPSTLTLAYLNKVTINHQASLIKLSLFKEMGLYDTSFSLAADYAFFLKCFYYGKHFEHMKEEVVNYQLDGASSLHEEEYKRQMNEAWNRIIPSYMNKLYRENESYEILMDQRILRWAKSLNENYRSFRNYLKNFK
jgi:glycosyltransferase involved in cell wall biosynthesis